MPARSILDIHKLLTSIMCDFKGRFESRWVLRGHNMILRNSPRKKIISFFQKEETTPEESSQELKNRKMGSVKAKKQ